MCSLEAGIESTINGTTVSLSFVEGKGLVFMDE